MRKQIATAAAVALLAVAFGGVVRTATAQSSAATREIVVVIRQDAMSATFLDFAEDGRMTQGDRVVFRGPLFNRAQTEQVGRATGECVVVSDKITETDGLWRCSYLLGLPDGNLTLDGLDPRGPGSSKFAILGGTETYRTAAGDADLVDKPGRTEMHLHVEV